MADSNRMEDSTTIELNPTVVREGGDNLAPVGDRPGAKGSLEAWGDYAVALGASRDTTGDLTKGELRDLADRLGG